MQLNYSLFLALSSYPDLFEVTLWKKGKGNKQFFKRRFLLSRKDFTLRYFIKGDVSCASHVLRITLCFSLMFQTVLPPNQVQGSQNCHLHEGPERSVPTGEDQPRSRSADLLPAWRTDEESLCLSWGRIRESFFYFLFSWEQKTAASDVCNMLNFCLGWREHWSSNLLHYR